MLRLISESVFLEAVIVHIENTNLRHFLAARDYPKISRASTNTTGSSLMEIEVRS